MKKIGFIGTGNMGGAIIGGILKSKKVAAEDMIGADHSPESRERAASLYGIDMTGDNRKAASESEILFLCVKPQFLDNVLYEIRDILPKDQLIVSIVAGRSIAYYQKMLGEKIRLVRLMPNTPALVGAGMTAACCSAEVSPEEMKKVGDLSDTGKTEKLSIVFRIRMSLEFPRENQLQRTVSMNALKKHLSGSTGRKKSGMVLMLKQQ